MCLLTTTEILIRMLLIICGIEASKCAKPVGNRCHDYIFCTKWVCAGLICGPDLFEEKTTTLVTPQIFLSSSFSD